MEYINEEDCDIKYDMEEISNYIESIPSSAEPSKLKRVEKKDFYQDMKFLIKTKMCVSVIENIHCPHVKCRFAHSLAELKPKLCSFGSVCHMVCLSEPNGPNSPDGTGSYKNVPNSKDKICSFWHPNETETSYALRMGLIKAPCNPVKYSEPIRLEIKTDEWTVVRNKSRRNRQRL